MDMRVKSDHENRSHNGRVHTCTLTTIISGETRPMSRSDGSFRLRFVHNEIADYLVGDERQLRQVFFVLHRVVPLFVVGSLVRYREFRSIIGIISAYQKRNKKEYFYNFQV